MLLAELYAISGVNSRLLSDITSYHRKPLPFPPIIKDWPAVDVFIPTYNEPLDVVRTTILAMQALD
jgi:cellulose synthase (UDP-forming)